VLLSYALCNQKNFAEASDLWRHHGAIDKLLRAPGAAMPESSSFLDSEGFYHRELKSAFRNMTDLNVRSDGEDPSEIQELDLFVTGTDFDGNVYTVFDDKGHPIDIKDHKGVFLLKHRAGRKEQFKPEAPNPEPTLEALAKLCRLTSSFPVAFSPVKVGFAKVDDGSADAKLQLWGQLGKETSFLDGGALDNKPFTYTLKAIFSRTADREVDRKLFYVEPDPEVMRQAEKAASPNILQTMLAALIGIPSYESIADDLRLLNDRNRKLQQYQRLVRDLQSSEDDLSGETGGLYIRSRLVSLTDRIIQGLFRKDGRTQQIPVELQERAARLIKAFDDNRLVDADAVLTDFDVPFRLRRLFRTVYLVYDLLYGEDEATPVEDRVRYRELWRVLNQQIKLCEILLWSLESLVNDSDIAWQNVESGKEGEIWNIIKGGYYRLLADDGPAAQRIQKDELKTILEEEKRKPSERKEGTKWLDEDSLQAIRADLKDVSCAIQNEVVTRRFTPGDRVPTLLSRVDECERLILDHFVPDPEDPVRKAYEGFERLDTHLFPLEMVGDLHEKDVIETIRISPRDAQRGFSSNDLPAKVAGDAVFHFGGFFKRSWRSNDILWGRLDGLCQLVETLLDYGRIASLVRSPGKRQRLRSRFLDGEVWRSALDPASLFPRSGDRTHDECRRWLSRLLGEDDKVREEALACEKFDEMVSLFVEAAQLEILHEDLPNVMLDAIQEQVEWNRFQVAKGKPPKPKKAEAPVSSLLPVWIFEPGKGRLNPLVPTTEAKIRVGEVMEFFGKDAKASARPSQSGLGTFFRESYRVGSEKLLRDIPTVVLLEILAKALLVARTCILSLFGTEQARIRRSPAFRFFVDWPLRAFYGLVRLSRRSPGWGLGVLLGLAALSIFAMAVGIIWWPELVRPDDKWSWRGVGFFFVAPAVTLFLETTFFFLVSRQSDRES